MLHGLLHYGFRRNLEPIGGFKKKILLVGMPDMALVCMAKMVAENVNIVACVPPQKTHNTYRLFCNFAKNLDLPVISYENSLTDEDFLSKIKALS